MALCGTCSDASTSGDVPLEMALEQMALEQMSLGTAYSLQNRAGKGAAILKRGRVRHLKKRAGRGVVPYIGEGAFSSPLAANQLLSVWPSSESPGECSTNACA